MEEFIEQIIYQLEKKQSEISTDIECAINDQIELDFQNEDFCNGYEKGYYQGIEMAILILKEKSYDNYL